MNKFFRAAVGFTVFAFVCFCLMTPSSVWAQTGAVEVSSAVHHDVSPPLWSIPSRVPHLQPKDRHTHPLVSVTRSPKRWIQAKTASEALTPPKPRQTHHNGKGYATASRHRSGPRRSAPDDRNAGIAAASASARLPG